MAAADTFSGRRRIDHLAEVLAGVLSRTRIQRLFTFSSWVTEYPVGTRIDLEEPSGSTALDVALEEMTRIEPAFAQLIILTDGVPNYPEGTLEAMDRLQAVRPCPVHVYFCGDDHDRGAKQFCEELMRHGGQGSTWGQHSLAQSKRLATELVLRIGHGGGASRG